MLGGQAGEVAGLLVARFGTIGRLMDASDDALARALPDHQMAASAIIAARKLTRIGLQESLVGSSVRVEDRKLQAFLISKLQSIRKERLHVVFADPFGNYISDETIAEGDFRKIPFEMRTIVERALDCGAQSFLMAHNHPSGDPQPSALDISATKRIIEVGRAVDLDFIDHLIVAGGKIFSMKKGVLL